LIGRPFLYIVAILIGTVIGCFAVLVAKSIGHAEDVDPTETGAATPAGAPAATTARA
jgi:xanthine/uracil permease